MVIGMMVGGGVVMWVKMWGYGVGVEKDLKRIVKNRGEIEERMKKRL